MPICCFCGIESYIKYDNHFLCRKHYHKAVNTTFEESLKKCIENIQGGNQNGIWD